MSSGIRDGPTQKGDRDSDRSPRSERRQGNSRGEGASGNRPDFSASIATGGSVAPPVALSGGSWVFPEAAYLSQAILAEATEATKSAASFSRQTIRL
jgi:hypothetical protein